MTRLGVGVAGRDNDPSGKDAETPTRRGKEGAGMAFDAKTRKFRGRNWGSSPTILRLFQLGPKDTSRLFAPLLSGEPDVGKGTHFRVKT